MSDSAPRRNFCNNEHPVTTDVDLSSDEFWWEKTFDEREESFARLRREAPVSWHLPRWTPEVAPEFRDAGFWAITKHADIQMISQDNETFSSALENGGVEFRTLDPNFELAPTFLMMDPPAHTRYRRIMSAAFTPKNVARLSDKINQRAREIVDTLEEGGEFDFVNDVAAKLPMLTVADLVGVPDSLAHKFAEAGEGCTAAADPDFAPEGMDRTAAHNMNVSILADMGEELLALRREQPADDIATALANWSPNDDGRLMNRDEIGSVMALLAVAGNDTTKQTTTHSLISLWKNPDQRDWLMEDYDGRIGQSLEEFVRHASVIQNFARCVRKDTELRGQKLEVGDKVVLFYPSGNRDEEVWPDASKFDLSREVNPHVGFGGGGVHFCLGNAVAKAQMRALFRELLTRVPDLVITGEPRRLKSDFVNGFTRLPVKVG